MKRQALGIILLFIFSPITRASSEYFPDVEGWKLKIEDRVYNPANLWEHINSAADTYLSYEFQDLHIAEYNKGKEKVVRIEIYRHSSIDNAFGIYASERMPDYTIQDIGVQGYTEPGILNFYLGIYYVKMMNAGTTEVSSDEIRDLALILSDYLNQKNNWPEPLQLFPDEGKIKLSESYISENFLGYSSLHSAYTVNYNNPEATFSLFIIHTENSNEVTDMFNWYTGIFQEDKVTRKDNYYIIQDLFNGKIILSIKGDYLMGAYNASDDSVAMDYLQKIRKQIP